MIALSSIRLHTAAVLAGLSLMLSGCFISPGKFASELTLLEDDQFTFTYDGEIYLLGLSQLVKQAQEQEGSQREFSAYCYGSTEEGEFSGDAEEAVEAAAEAAEAAIESVEATEMSVAVAASDEYGRRDCTPEEEAEQRDRWEEQQEQRRERDRQQTEQISKFIGGIDPTDPEAEQELARLLMRQKGFDTVVAKGDGLFEVSYSISGTLSHDYMFPMMEDFPTISPFVQLFLRDGDLVRVNAPGFAPQSSSNPILPLMMYGAPFGRGSSREGEALANIPPVNGTFTIITTGDIRANNTDEGPVTEAGRKRLTWTINARSKSSPTALIALPR